MPDASVLEVVRVVPFWLSVTELPLLRAGGVIEPEIVKVGVGLAEKADMVTLLPVTETLWFAGVNSRPALVGVTT